MRPLFAPRAAEEFDRALSGTAPQSVSDRYADLLGAVERLRSTAADPSVLPRPEFSADLRARLMIAAETELVPAVPVVRHLPQDSSRAPGPRHLGSIAAALVIVGGTAGMAAAASGALPGEALYPVKRGIEQVSTAIHVGDAGKGSALLGQAGTRLREARELQSSGADPDLVTQVVEDFRTEATVGADHLFAAYGASGRDRDITQVRGFAASRMDDLARLSEAGDPVTAGALLDAADTLADIDQQARELCAACGSAGGLDLPATLSSGAGAASLETLLARPVAQARRDIQVTRRAVAAAQQARLDRITELRGDAEATAGTIPRIDPSPVAGAGDHAADGAPTAPMTSTLTPDGGLVESVTVTGGSAVARLVGGVTGTVSSTTASITEGTPLQHPVEQTLKELDTTLKGVTGGLPGVSRGTGSKGTGSKGTGSQGTGGLLP